MNNHDPILLTIPAHLVQEVEAVLSQNGLHMNGIGNNFKLVQVPYLIRSQENNHVSQ